MKLFKNKKIIILTLFIAAIIVLSIFADKFAPNNPYQTDMTKRFAKISYTYPFGTDQLGRCILSRIIYGSKISVFTAFFVMIVTVIIGITLGVVASFGGKIAETAIMWICEIILAFPGMILSLVIVGIMGPGIVNLTLSMALTSWAKYTRVTRSLILSVKKSDYVRAAKTMGCTKFKIIIRHILPNIISPLIIMSVSSLGSIILRMAGMSFIGLGSQPPEAEWGMMINEARSYLSIAPGMVFFPMGAIFITVLLFNLLGDELRNNLDPNSYNGGYDGIVGSK